MALTTTVPFAPCVTDVTVNGSLSGSLSLASTATVTACPSVVAAASFTATGAWLIGIELSAYVIVTESTMALAVGVLLVNSIRYFRYRPCGLVMSAPLEVRGPDQGLHVTPSVEVLVRSCSVVPAGTVAAHVAVVQVDWLCPMSCAQLWYEPAARYVGYTQMRSTSSVWPVPPLFDW